MNTVYQILALVKTLVFKIASLQCNSLKKLLAFLRLLIFFKLSPFIWLNYFGIINVPNKKDLLLQA